MKPSRVVNVEIHGQRYAVRSDLDPEYIAQLAAYFDDKMRMASAEIQSVDGLCIAVIAALNVADELFRVRADGRGLGDQVRMRAAELERIVDRVLADATNNPIAANS
jgi:cell division protein ZapA